MIGKILNGRYQILEKVGTGGMAIVYLAQDKLLEREVAIKILQAQFIDNKEVIEQFTREAQAVARFSHPNIVNIFDIGQSNETYYIVMEYISGMDLKEKIEQNSKLSIKESFRIIKKVCRALIKAHQNNIIHCDIKPHNILITEDGRVKVTDFGIAQAITDATITQTDKIIGSAHYLSPEQAKGSKVSVRSDIYSLGIVFYELLTGEVPFTGENSVSVALKHIEEEPKPIREIDETIPKKLEKIIIKAIAKDPEARYSSVVEFLKDLDEVKDKIKLAEQEDLASQKTLLISAEERKKKLDKLRKQKQAEKQNSNNEENDNSQEKIKQQKQSLDDEISTSKADEKELDESDKSKNKEVDAIDEDDLVVEKSAKLKEKTKSNDKKFPVKKLLKVTFVFFAIISFIIFSGYYFLISYLTVAEVEVPNFIGESLELTEDTLEEKGLNLEVYHETHNNEIDEGHIISQNIEPGRIVKENRTINVVLSKGPELREVPDLAGESFRDARIEINSLDLVIGEQEKVYSEEYSEDIIIEQEPESGEEIKTDTPINLVISRGPEPEDTQVPDLIGLDETDAIEELRENNLLVGDINIEDSLEYREGQVIEQEEEAGADIKEGSTVALTVSSGIRNPYDSEVNTSTVRSYVPPGRDRTVTVEIEDDNGQRIVYEETHSAQERVEVEVITVGSATIRVYMNGNLSQERNI